VEGLKAMDDEIVESHYADVVGKIGQLDKDDQTGFVKAAKEAAAKKEAAKKQQAALQEWYVSKIMPLMKAKEFDKALDELKSYIKDNPALPEEIQVNMIVRTGLAGPMEKKDAAAAMAVVDAGVKEYPNSDFAKHVDKIKESIKAAIASAPPAETPEKSAEDK